MTLNHHSRRSLLALVLLPSLWLAGACTQEGAPSPDDLATQAVAKPTLKKTGWAIQNWFGDDDAWTWSDVTQDDLDEVTTGLNKALAADGRGYRLTHLAIRDAGPAHPFDAVPADHVLTFCVTRIDTSTGEPIGYVYARSTITDAYNTVSMLNMSQIGKERRPLHQMKPSALSDVPGRCR